jgi:hypothetical protein
LVAASRLTPINEIPPPRANLENGLIGTSAFFAALVVLAPGAGWSLEVLDD